MRPDVQQQKEFYQALIDKNPDYEGRFFVGVLTTQIFCRPTCPARKPKFENCQFYTDAQQALLAGFRPCMRCRPLAHPQQISEIVQTLIAAVEKDPYKRWTDYDFQQLSIDVSTVRRQFKKRFGMTFVQYARAYRMGLALHHIKQGASVIETQINTGYESSSGFTDAFRKMMGAAPTHFKDHHKILTASWIDTQLGPMIVIADDEALYLLEFVDRRGLQKEIERLLMQQKAVIVPGMTSPIDSIKQELAAYFAGMLQKFSTPIRIFGSTFQQSVWQQLQKIPYGQTRSYLEQAQALGKPTASRAVANANGANQLAIIIPCHRIITSSGDLGGYGGGVWRKQSLLHLEKMNKSTNKLVY